MSYIKFENCSTKYILMMDAGYVLYGNEYEKKETIILMSFLTFTNIKNITM